VPCRPSEAQHTTTDAAPCSLVVGGSSNGKQRVNEQPSEPSQAWEAICIRRDAGALHFEVHGGALRKRSAPTWIDIFTTTSSLRGCKPWKRLPAWRSAGLMARPYRPPTVMPVRGRRCVADPSCVPSLSMAALARAAATWRVTCQQRSPCGPDRTACRPPMPMPRVQRPGHPPTPTSSSRPCPSARPTICACSVRS
jgi:hypothetical protein